MPVPAHPRPDSPASGFRLLVVPGVIPNKWSGAWSERRPDTPLDLVRAEVADQAALLADGRVDAGLVRLPVDRDTCDAIPLYTEATVVVVPRDHLLTAADQVTLADLADLAESGEDSPIWPLDNVLSWAGTPGIGTPHPGDPPSQHRPTTTASAVGLVASGLGVLVVPQSLARLHHRRDLTYRVVTDAPTSSVALAWVRERYTDLVEEMIGIVRGRTVNSTRGRERPAAPPSCQRQQGQRQRQSRAQGPAQGRTRGRTRGR